MNDDSQILAIGSPLPLLSRALAPLGALLAIAAISARSADSLATMPAAVIFALGCAALLWARGLRTVRYAFDPAARRVRIEQRRGRHVECHELTFDEVQDVIVTLLEGSRDTLGDSPRQLPTFELQLLTRSGRWPIHDAAMLTWEQCEALAARILRVLDREPTASLLERSYRAALRLPDRLQALCLLRFRNPSLSLTEADARVRADLQRAPPRS